MFGLLARCKTALPKAEAVSLQTRSPKKIVLSPPNPIIVRTAFVRAYGMGRSNLLGVISPPLFHFFLEFFEKDQHNSVGQLIYLPRYLCLG